MTHQPIEEFKSLLHQEDYSQLSRKLLDLSMEFSLDASLEQLIYDFRKNYLNEISKEVLKDDAVIILNAITTITFEEQKQDNSTHLVCDAKHISKHYVNGGNPFHLQPLDVQLRFGEITGIVC